MGGGRSLSNNNNHHPRYQYTPVYPQIPSTSNNPFETTAWYNNPPPTTSPPPPPLPPKPPAAISSYYLLPQPEPMSTQGQHALRLIYTKSGFFVRSLNVGCSQDIHGFLSIVSRNQAQVDIALAWIPEHLIDTQDLGTFIDLDGTLASEQGFPNIAWNSGDGEAMLIPIADIYSLYVCPPSSSASSSSSNQPIQNDDHGSIIITTRQGDVLRPLWYHATAAWPGYDIIDILGAFIMIQRVPDDEYTYLVQQPTSYENSNIPDSGDSTYRHPLLRSPSTSSSAAAPSPTSATDAQLHQAIRDARFNILERFSRITRFSRDTAAHVLDHPIAKAIIPLLPPSVQAMRNNDTVQQTMNDYDRATYYLAQWGDENENSANEWWRVDDPEGLLSDMPEMNMPTPTHTRRDPIEPEEWVDFFDNEGKLRVTERHVLGLVFRGGLHPDVRIEAWKFILGIYPWDSTFDEREAIRRSKVDEYYEFKARWFNDMEVRNTKHFMDEKHRIDKDVHRTDRTIAVFEGEDLPNPDPDMAVGTNANMEIMKDILVTYNFHNTELGYVQGMSDLLAPIFVAMGTEEMAFWCFVQFMNRVQCNFFIDQSGMHGQLQTLDALIRFMDAPLYKHFEETETSNLFFCFRWLLVWFKREFEWDDVIQLWEVLWTDHLSPQMIMFIALAVLDKHRQVLLDLQQFDEVLKYINELSGTINLRETLERAEVLFYLFERKIKAMDRKRDQLKERLQMRSVWNGEERPKVEKSIQDLQVDDKLRALLKKA